jgi:mannose/fructose/N-acetylgalactosamine-specific phosphotransferase system component IIC
VSLLAGCAALAVLELDATLIAQTLLSRPLVAGAVVGVITGRAQAGVLFGASYELLGLCNLPVGGCMNWSGTVAAGTAAMLSSAGAAFAPCFAGGLAAGAAHAWLEGFERARRARTGDALAVRAESGGSALGRSFAASIAAHAAMTFAVAGGATALVAFADGRWWPVLPGFLRAGAAVAASSAPWIGLSGVAMWGLRRA